MFGHVKSMQPWDLSLPGGRAKCCCKSGEYPPEEGVRVFSREDKVNSGEHKETMDGVSNNTAGNIFSQTGEQRSNILHLDDLVGYKEHDTQRSIPVERQKVREQNSAVDP